LSYFPKRKGEKWAFPSCTKLTMIIFSVLQVSGNKLEERKKNPAEGKE
jgi:hypothetical protein